MSPLPSSVPLFFQLIFVLIAASAAIGAAVITARYSKATTHRPHHERRIFLQKKGAILNCVVRIFGPEGFEKTFKNGEVWLPILNRQSNYEIYVSEIRLGRIRNPASSDDEVLVIDLEVESYCWEPAE